MSKTLEEILANEKPEVVHIAKKLAKKYLKAINFQILREKRSFFRESVK